MRPAASVSAPYAVIPLGGTFGDEGGGIGALFVPTPGLQNGSPDGLALVDDLGVVLEFSSYEGSFAAVSGSAPGAVFGQPAESKPAAAEEADPAATDAAPPVSAFKPAGFGKFQDTNRWACGTCLSKNSPDVDVCASCEAPKDGATPKPKGMRHELDRHLLR